MASPRLTALIVSHDPDIRLTQTLDSVQDLADEIVMGTTSDHPMLAALGSQRATRFLHVPLKDDLADVHNQILARVRGQWVLWLQPGECCDPTSASAIRSWVDSQPEPAPTHLLVRESARGKTLEPEQSLETRLFPKLPGLRFRGRTCPKLTSFVEMCPEAPGIIESTDQDAAQILSRRARRVLRLATLEAAESGESVELLLARAQAHEWLGDPEESSTYYQRAMRRAAAKSRDHLAACYGYLSQQDQLGVETEVCVEICLKALEDFPHDLQLLCALGGYLQAVGRLDMACRAYQVACEVGQLRGDDERAIEVLKRELDTRDSHRLRRHLLDLHIKRGDLPQARTVLEASELLQPQRHELRQILQGALLASARRWQESRALLEPLYEAGIRDPLCRRWLGVTLLALGESERGNTILDSFEPSAVAPATGSGVSVPWRKAG